LEDGRLVKLAEPFSYIDPDEKSWEVPAGATVDGASIPRALWTLIGGPFEDKYRNASIIHDWYCDVRSRPWKDTHRVFYHAMITSSVPIAQAKLLFAGVYWGGPRWSQTVVENIVLATTRTLGFVSSFAPEPMFETVRRRMWRVSEYSFDDSQLDLLQESVKDGDESLESIESSIDLQLESMEPEVRDEPLA
jgi:hypothetical protein